MSCYSLLVVKGLFILFSRLLFYSVILKEQVGLPALFERVGPLVDDWESYLRDIAEDLDQQKEQKNSDQLSKEEQLFIPVHYLKYR